ncbi:MAG: SRPBCC family protein [Planctomycetes bacterium]|nr:SRPBCC family protein [Planctomycetota bacterium]
MKVVKFCLLPVLAVFVLGGLAAWWFTKDLPREWNVDVSVDVDAPAAEIHPWIEDLHRWPEWSAFREQYPDDAYTFTGAERGVGAEMTTVGGGSRVHLVITASDPTKGVWFDETLEDKLNAKGVILYEEHDGRTTLRWQDHGQVGDFFLMRLAVRVLQDRLSDAFAKNLAVLKQKVEAQ